MQARLGPEVYSSWFTSVVVRDLVGGRLRVTASAPLIRRWIAQHYSEQMTEAGRVAFGTTLTTVDVIAPEPASAPAPTGFTTTIH